MDKLLWVGLGGWIGASARYLLATWIISLGIKFPIATLVINVSGSFLLGAFLTWFSTRAQLPDSLRLLIATGFCGAYTTFSTYAYESIMLLRGGDLIAAIANIVLTNTLCLFACLIGIALFYGKV
ncbi:MAG: fluoride efflux transporter CrcB [Anaerolineae bacterium]|jgi:CrcB protein|nr:fluoride efflux transporter CrcB [Anaerolineae bacterium]